MDKYLKYKKKYLKILYGRGDDIKEEKEKLEPDTPLNTSGDDTAPVDTVPTDRAPVDISDDGTKPVNQKKAPWRISTKEFIPSFAKGVTTLIQLVTRDHLCTFLRKQIDLTSKSYNAVFTCGGNEVTVEVQSDSSINITVSKVPEPEGGAALPQEEVRKTFRTERGELFPNLCEETYELNRLFARVNQFISTVIKKKDLPTEPEERLNHTALSEGVRDRLLSVLHNLISRGRFRERTAVKLYQSDEESCVVVEEPLTPRIFRITTLTLKQDKEVVLSSFIENKREQTVKEQAILRFPIDHLVLSHNISSFNAILGLLRIESVSQGATVLNLGSITELDIAVMLRQMLENSSFLPTVKVTAPDLNSKSTNKHVVFLMKNIDSGSSKVVFIVEKNSENNFVVFASHNEDKVRVTLDGRVRGRTVPDSLKPVVGVVKALGDHLNTHEEEADVEGRVPSDEVKGCLTNIVEIIQSVTQRIKYAIETGPEIRDPIKNEVVRKENIVVEFEKVTDGRFYIAVYVKDTELLHLSVFPISKGKRKSGISSVHLTTRNIPKITVEGTTSWQVRHAEMYPRSWVWQPYMYPVETPPKVELRKLTNTSGSYGHTYETSQERVYRLSILEEIVATAFHDVLSEHCRLSGDKDDRKYSAVVVTEEGGAEEDSPEGGAGPAEDDEDS